MKPSRFPSILLVGAILAGCGGTTEPEGGPPPLPPDASFLVPFDNFQATPLAAGFAADASFQPGLTWGAAALTVGIWNTIIAVTLAAPVASFVAAINQTPAWKGDHWEWSYNFQVGTQQHSARLLAEAQADGYNWSMFISGPNYSDFNWYNGFSDLDGGGGFWQLDVGPQDRTPFMSIEWSHDAASSISSIKYTNQISRSSELGGFINFTNQPVESFDRWYTVFSAANANTTDIQWNSVTSAGRINGPQSNGSVNWRCWDANLDDVACII